MSHALSQKGCRRGWTVLNHRGHARLNIAAGAGRGRRRQVLLPIPWECDQVDHIRDAVVQVYEEFQQGIEPDACVARMPRADGSRAAEGEFGSGRGTQTGHPGRPRHRGMAAVLAPADWEELIAAFREHKLISGEIKPSTWHRVYRHHMNHVLGAVAAVTPPQNAKQLLETLARIWADKPGGRTRQIQIQSTAALLRWAVADRRLGEDWEPPQDLAVFVGRSRAAKAITTPLEVEHILALVRAIPDARWRFAFQLMAAYGLRPEELQHLQIRQGRLWCMYEKVASRGKSRPRVLRPLPCDDWADGWRLEERFPTQELPPMQPGLGGGYVGHYLMNRPLWKELRREYEAKGEKLVPCSCRHGYAHRAHVICDLPPKVVAAAMGHSVQTHLAAYSRWCGDDVVDDAFAKAEQRLGQG
ncbi:phage integrase family protein [Synechococcus sp. A15-44]|nr:phage integrase family protein [Synechococcus sp. A15-44]